MDALEAYIQDRLKNFYRQKVSSVSGGKVRNLSSMEMGWETEIYSFTLSFEKDGSEKSEELIVRLYQGRDAEEKATREYNIIKKLGEFQFPVPETYILENDSIYLGCPFIIMEKINGPLMKELLGKSNEKEVKRLLKIFCENLVRLHKIGCRNFEGFFPLDKILNPEEYTKKQINAFRNYLHSYKRNEFDEVINWMEKRVSEINFDKLSLIHFDYHPGNILMRNSEEPVIIDWAGSSIQDRRMDLAWTLLLVSTYGNPEFYDIILNLYAEISGKEIQGLKLFEAMACIRRLASIWISIIYGADKLGMRLGVERKMIKEVEHIKKVYSILEGLTGIAVPEVEDMIEELEGKR